MSKYEIDVWEYADEFKNLDTNETFYGYQVCELLEHKDQQISDLEAKLAEAQKTIEIQKMSNNALQEENLDYRYDITDTAYEQAKYMAESWEEDYQQEITELKHQLAEKDKQIADLQSQLAEKENEIGDVLAKQSITCLNTIEKAYQDKISFAVEQLEKARKLIDELLDNCGDKQYKVWEVFDNQINELKEMR